MLKCLAKYHTDFYEISLAEERSLIIVEFDLSRHEAQAKN